MTTHSRPSVTAIVVIVLNFIVRSIGKGEIVISRGMGGMGMRLNGMGMRLNGMGTRLNGMGTRLVRVPSFCMTS